MPPQGVLTCPKKDILNFEEICGFVCMVQETHNLSKIKITGGEPLLRHELPQLIKMLISQGCRDVSLTTNGQLLEKRAEELAGAGLKRVNVSLDSINPGIFRGIAGCNRLEATLKGIEKAQELGLTPIKINCVVLRNSNLGGIPEFLEFCIKNEWQLRFLELMPIGPAIHFYQREFVSSRKVRQFLRSRGFQLDLIVRTDNQVASEYSVKTPTGLTGRAGFISSQTGSFCNGCTKLRLTASGQLIPCLMQNFSTDIRPYLFSKGENSKKRFNRILDWALRCKLLNRQNKIKDHMAAIGG
jgi:cyclic pyranopterin phosphate synthase